MITHSLCYRSIQAAIAIGSSAWEARMDDEPEQDALFYIEGPDEDGLRLDQLNG